MTVENNLAQQTLKKMTSVWDDPGFHLVLISKGVSLPSFFGVDRWFVYSYDTFKKLEKEHKLRTIIRDRPPNLGYVITNVPSFRNKAEKIVIRDLDHLLPQHVISRATTISELFYNDLLYVAKARYEIEPGTIFPCRNSDWIIVNSGTKQTNYSSTRPFVFDNLYYLIHHGASILNNIQDRCTGPQIKILKNLLQSCQMGNSFGTWIKTCKRYPTNSLKSLEKLGLVEVKESWKTVNHKDGSFHTEPDNKFKLTPLGQVFLDCAVVVER